jgi:hypothetical protein
MKTFMFYAVYALAFFSHIALYCTNDQKKKPTTQKNPSQFPQQIGTIPAGNTIHNSSKSSKPCHCRAPHNAEVKCSTQSKRDTL